MTGITVAIPVGPVPGNRRWLGECLESVRKQTRQPDEVLMISDMAGLPVGTDYRNPYPIRTWATPWRVGVACAFNFGVALAKHNLVLMLGSDDWLEPECLEKCLEAWELHDRREAYYWFPIWIDDPPRPQGLPTNAAMVTKGFFRQTGGFPLEANIGMQDRIFMAVISKHFADRLVLVHDYPLYYARSHPDCETFLRLPGWSDVAELVHRRVADLWKRPDWTDRVRP